MQNFEQKFKQEKTVNTIELNNTIKTETLDTKKPESHEDLTKRLRTNLEQSKSLKEKIQEDAEHLNKIRQALGLGHQTEDTVSMRANKEKLASLGKEYSEMHNTILGDDTYSIDNLEGVFNENETHMGYDIATKNNLTSEKRARNSQNSWEKIKEETTQRSRDIAERIHGGGMEMSDEEWNAKVAKEKADKKKFYEETEKSLNESENKRKQEDEAYQQKKDEYFKNFDSQKTHDEIMDSINGLNDPDGSKREYEKKQNEAWEGYEDSVKGMNENIGHKPINAEKYKSQLEKEWGEKGKSKEEIEEEWQRIKNNPHASWI